MIYSTECEFEVQQFQKKRKYREKNIGKYPVLLY